MEADFENRSRTGSSPTFWMGRPGCGEVCRRAQRFHRRAALVQSSAVCAGRIAVARISLCWILPAGHPSNGEKFYLYKDRTETPDVMTVHDRCTCLPGNRWILYDPYPDTDRRQLPLGHFLSPMPYPAEWRCDPHPRYSPDGRQMYLIDIGDLRA